MNDRAWKSYDGMTPSRSSMLARCAVAAIVFVAWAPSVRADVVLDLTTNNSGGFTLDPGDNTFSFSAFSVEYLIVAGGGGGGGRYFSRSGGGGGAGGLLTGTTNITGLQTITVGAGGAGATGINSNNATNGGNSSISGIATATGGGRGGHNGGSGANGGSGGGGGGHTSTNSGGTGVGGQGFAGGGNDNSQAAQPGGGGGAGGAGQTSSAGSAGGAGATSSITGTLSTYAEGGDGGRTIVNGVGPGASGAANTGNGGDGGRSNDVNGNSGKGGAGGSGIIVVRYTGPQVLTGGTVSTVSGDTVHQFLSTGASTLDLFSATIDGVIGGAGNLVWDKTGILTLGGANTYTGSTQIDSGTIELSGSIGSTSDLTFGSGVLDLGSTGLIRVLQANYSIADANTDIGSNQIQGSGLVVSTFNDGSNDYTQILAVPEPTVLALAACGGAIGLAVLRRRRKTASA